jgi:hypothetical protein
MLTAKLIFSKLKKQKTYSVETTQTYIYMVRVVLSNYNCSPHLNLKGR